MPTIIQFRNRPNRTVRSRRFRPSSFNALWIAILVAGFALTHFSWTGDSLLELPEVGGIEAPENGITRYFATCDSLRRDDCVIDGDTFALRGERIRIADIDAPETHPPRCGFEARLGEQATRRLQELLNAGPFALKQAGFRDEDRYGRKLRTVVRDGRSLGDVLVSEGLARQWTGRRLPWCS